MKKWLVEHFLPMWAKETVLRENRQLRRTVRLLEQQIERKNAYIKGLEEGNRTCRWLAKALVAGGEK